MTTTDPLLIPQSVKEEEAEGKVAKDVVYIDNRNVHYDTEKDSVQLAAVDEIDRRPKRIGLSIEELEEYRHHALFRPLRMALFVLFWLAWIAMFLGAIIIVAVSPRCVPKEKLKWWQTKVSYQVWVPSFQDSNGDGRGDIGGLIERLDLLRKIGVQTVWTVPVIKTAAFDYGVTDFTSIDEKIGTLDQFRSLVDETHSKSMYLIMELPVATVSTLHPWFLSIAQEGASGFKDYFIWKRNPPISSLDASFWTEYKKTSQFYMHYKNMPSWPILNWDNPTVRREITAAAEFWIDQGIDGLYIGFVDYLSRSMDATQTNWNQTVDWLAELQDSIEQHANTSETSSKNDILIFTSVSDSDFLKKLALVERGGLNYIINHDLLHATTPTVQSCPNTTTIVSCFHSTLADWLETQSSQPADLHPMWELGNPHISRLATRLNNDRLSGELFTFIQQTLPGSLNFYYGELIGMEDAKESKLDARHPYRGAMQWDTTENAGFSSATNLKVPLNSDYQQINFRYQRSHSPSQLKTFKKLAKLRQIDETLMMGNLTLGSLTDNCFAFSRTKWRANVTVGYIYLGLINFGTTDNTVDFSRDNLYPMDTDLSSAEVVTLTSAMKHFKARDKLDLTKQSFNMGPKQGILFRF